MKYNGSPLTTFKIENPLDLNLASAKDLETVPNIGKITASRIVERRETKGDFNSIQELSEIPQITQNKINTYRWHECFKIQR